MIQGPLALRLEVPRRWTRRPSLASRHFGAECRAEISPRERASPNRWGEGLACAANRPPASARADCSRTRADLGARSARGGFARREAGLDRKGARNRGRSLSNGARPRRTPRAHPRRHIGKSRCTNEGRTWPGSIAESSSMESTEESLGPIPRDCRVSSTEPSLGVQSFQPELAGLARGRNFADAPPGTIGKV